MVNSETTMYKDRSWFALLSRSILVRQEKESDAKTDPKTSFYDDGRRPFFTAVIIH
jgi:hypothetical protein